MCVVLLSRFLLSYVFSLSYDAFCHCSVHLKGTHVELGVITRANFGCVTTTCKYSNLLPLGMIVLKGRGSHLEETFRGK